VPVSTEGPVEHPLRGGAREDVREGLGDGECDSFER
jgi:hypothetical protein